MGHSGRGKTHAGGMPGIYPRHNAIQISVGFSPWGMLFAGNHAFFRNLFSRAANARKWTWALPPEG